MSFFFSFFFIFFRGGGRGCKKITNARALPPSVIESKKIWTKGGEREREKREREPRRELFFVCVDPSTTKKR